MLVLLLLIATGFTWATAAAQAVAGTAAAERATAWVLRHRTALTVVAACGPLPYALARLTWLTPWPALAPDPAALDVATRVWGVVLSSGAWLGVVLTIGLLRQWGEVFPRWVPGVAGRPVPVAAAAVPGGVIAAVLTFSAVPMLHLAATTGGVGQFMLFAIVFPCWVWGPALALAVWGYVAHRRGTGAGVAPDGGARAAARALAT
jgi:hypothetical protein